MIDLHTQEVLLELLDQISEHMETVDELDDDDRLSATESILQDIQDKLSSLVERDG